MGNYNGSVRCGHCYEQGHNKRSCPTYTERIQRRYEEAKASGEQSNVRYYAGMLAKRTGVNPETGESVSRRNESRGRRCSYCRDYGHSRRTCPALKQDVANYVRMASVVRRDMLASMREHGMGTGALVTVEGREWDPEQSNYVERKNAYVVAEIVWNNITPHNPGAIDTLRVRSVKNMRDISTMAIPAVVTGSTQGYGVRPTLASSSDIINPPGAWLAGVGADEASGLFEKGNRRQEYWLNGDYAQELLNRWAGIEPESRSVPA